MMLLRWCEDFHFKMMIKTIEFDGFDKIYFNDRTIAAQ